MYGAVCFSFQLQDSSKDEYMISDGGQEKEYGIQWDREQAQGLWGTWFGGGNQAHGLQGTQGMRSGAWERP